MELFLCCKKLLGMEVMDTLISRMEHQMPSSPTMPAYSTLLATNLCKLHILCKHGSGSSFINPTMVAADDSILGPFLSSYYLLNASPIPTTMKGGERVGQQRD
jgi:hypothetical protein